MLFPWGFTENHYLAQAKLAGHRIHAPHFFFKHYKKRLLFENQKLTKRLLQTSSPYLFHPTYYNPSFLEYIGDHPYVITVHDMIHELFSEYFHDAKEVMAQKKEVITKASRIIAISENTKKDIVNILNIDPQKIDVIYHGTSIKSHHGKTELSLPNRYILFVGDRTLYIAKLMQAGQGTFRIRTGHVAKHDAGGQFAVDRHVCGHLVRRKRSEQRVCGFGLADGRRLRRLSGRGDEGGYNCRLRIVRHSVSYS